MPSLLAGWVAGVILIVLLCGVTAGAAQAHVFHDLEVPHAAAVPDHPISAEAAEGDAAAPVAVDSSDCSITCCSPAHCAAGLAGSCQTAALDRAAADRFALPGAMKAGPFEQGARQRPPRS